MDIDEYEKQELEIQVECNKKLHQLRKKYVEENAKFKVGDFIFNVTGIIKIEKIGYKMLFDIPDIIYYGHRYKKRNGVLSRTKDNKMSSLRSSVDLLTI